MSKQAIVLKIQQIGLEYGPKIAAALAILVIGFWLSRFVSRLVEKSMLKTKVDPTLAVFIRNLVYTAMLIFMGLAVLGQLGIQTTSFIAVLGAAGLAVGLALQGTMSNFASGVLLILLHPFKVGDQIKVAGFDGVVKEIQIFSTILVTAENKRVIIPNSKVTGDTIVNSSV